MTQHIEYMAFGEIFVEEGEGDDIFGDDEGVRYLFNAKELDASLVRAFLRQSRPGYDGWERSVGGRRRGFIIMGRGIMMRKQVFGWG